MIWRAKREHDGYNDVFLSFKQNSIIAVTMTNDVSFILHAEIKEICSLSVSRLSARKLRHGFVESFVRHRCFPDSGEIESSLAISRWGSSSSHIDRGKKFHWLKSKKDDGSPRWYTTYIWGRVSVVEPRGRVGIIVESAIAPFPFRTRRSIPPWESRRDIVVRKANRD